jgi:uncharacterized protein
MRVVIDTNVLLQMAAAGTKSPLLVFWQARQFDLYLSHEIVNELKALLSRPKIQRFVSQTSGKQFLDLLGERAVFVIPATNYPRCRDADDDMVIATAVAAQADYLITIDKDIYDDSDLANELSAYAIKTLTPGRFQSLLRA